MSVSKGHWTKVHPGTGQQLAIAVAYNGMPFITIVKTVRARGKTTASIPWNRILFFWSVQCKVKQ